MIKSVSLSLQESNTESRFYEEQTSFLPQEEEPQTAAASGARVKFNNQILISILPLHSDRLSAS